MKCSRCGAEMENDALFCSECGKKLTKRCTFCGAEIPAEAKFCNECGVRYEAVSPREPEKSPETKLTAVKPVPAPTNPIRRMVEEKKENERSRAEAERREKEEQQRQRRERLAELESLRNQPGYSLLHPLQYRKNAKEAEELRSTIERVEKELAAPKKNSNRALGALVLTVCAGILSMYALTGSRGTEAAGEKPAAPVEQITAVSAAAPEASPTSTPAPTPKPKSTPVPKPVTSDAEETPIRQNEAAPEQPVQRSAQTGSSGNTSPSVTVPTQSETTGDLVWVPVNGGKKYHRNSSCSNMENPMQVSRETAEANGYDPCKRCYG